MSRLILHSIAPQKPGIIPDIPTPEPLTHETNLDCPNIMAVHNILYLMYYLHFFAESVRAFFFKTSVFYSETVDDAFLELFKGINNSLRMHVFTRVLGLYRDISSKT